MHRTPTNTGRMNALEAHRKVYLLSEMWMIGWGLLIWTLALNQSPYNPWEQFVVLPLSLISSQVRIRLARRCILSLHFLRAIDRCKFARERILKDFGLSVSNLVDLRVAQNFSSRPRPKSRTSSTTMTSTIEGTEPLVPFTTAGHLRGFVRFPGTAGKPHFIRLNQRILSCYIKY
jgi:hypothetical protein